MKVLFFNPEQYLDFENEPSNYQCRLPILNCGLPIEPVDHVYQRDLRSDGREAMDRAALAAVDAARPDVVVYSATWEHENLSPHALAAMRRRGVPVVSVLWDSWIEPTAAEAELLANSDVLVVCDSLHSYFRCRMTAARLSPPPRVVFGGGQVFTDVLYPRPDVAKTVDVLMLGSNEGRRVGLVGRLSEELPRRGVSFRKAGGLVDSRKERFRLTDGWVSWPEYARLINGARICLCSATDPTRLQIKGKIFDFMACGAFCLTDSNAETDLLLPPGVAGRFTDEADCVERILHYLGDAGERERIAEAGRRWLGKTFDYKRFWSGVLAAARDSALAAPVLPELETIFAGLCQNEGLLLRRELATAQRIVRLGLGSQSCGRLTVSWLGRLGDFYVLGLGGKTCVALNRLPADFVESDGEILAVGDGFGTLLLNAGWTITPDRRFAFYRSDDPAEARRAAEAMQARIADGEMAALARR